jgi:hypothetical protein
MKKKWRLTCPWVSRFSQLAEKWVEFCHLKLKPAPQNGTEISIWELNVGRDGQQLTKLIDNRSASHERLQPFSRLVTTFDSVKLQALCQ